MNRIKGILYAAVSSATFGLAPFFSISLLAIGYSSFEVLTYRWGVATVVLLVFAFLTKCDFHIGYKNFKTIFGLSLLRALTSFSLVIAYQNIASGVASIIPFMYSFILFGKYAANEKKRQMVAGILIIYFLSNCSLALIERILGFHLFEYSDSMKLGASFRSFAFGGHPLANAVVISTIMNFLWITEISPIKKIQYSVLCFMALFCFNTRFAIVVTAFFFCVFILHLMRERGISFRIKQHVMSICFIMGIVFCFLISYTSFGGRLMNIGLYDDDSAGARLQVLLVFDKYAYSDFIWGMTLDETTELMHSSGIYGVINENPWLIFLFRFGLIFTIIMVTVFFLYFKQIIKGISFYEKSIIVLPMLFIISSFNSIGVDSVALSVWVLCCYAFLPIRNTK